MKKIMLLILVLFSINVYADACSTDEMTRLRKLAEKIEFNYDYTMKKVKTKEENYEYPIFKITANNMDKQLKLLIINDFYNNDYLEFKYNDSRTSTLDGFSEGEKVTVTMKAFTANACSSRTVLTKTINLPYYNQNYEEEYCSNHNDFKYCVEFANNKISNDEYYSAKDEYEAKLNNDNNSQEEFKYEEGIDWIKIILIGSLGLIVVSILILYFANRRRKNEL